MKILLVGNANVGKTTIFNSLTKSNEHVGNWHGVTVSASEKKLFFRDRELSVVDLPGLYSLETDANEEIVGRDIILNRDYDCIIYICEVSNLSRNLYLAYQLMYEKLPLIIAVNMVDELKKTGRTIDFKLLEQRLNVPIIPLSAKKQTDLGFLLEKAVEFINANRTNKELKKKTTFKKAIENTESFDSAFAFNSKSKTAKKSIDAYERTAEALYADIDMDLNGVIHSSNNYVHGISGFDKLLLNRYLAIPIFLAIMGTVFFVTFGFLGAFLSGLLDNLINDIIGNSINTALISLDVTPWIVALVCNGIIGGLGGILVFLPQVLLLYLFLAILEDSGYMSRVAFMTDGLFSRIGLSGKSAFTLLMGFGCSATAVLTARNLEDKKIRLKTILLTPFMSCSARLPIFATLGALFFLGVQPFILFFLYMLGIVIALLLAFIMNKIPSMRTDVGNFIMEMPPYRIPQLRRVFNIIYHNIKAFLIRIGTLIFAVNVIVWIISNFSITQGYLSGSPDNSIMAGIAGALSFIFAPLGFGNWRAVTAILSGLVAKEVVVSTLVSLGSINDIFNQDTVAVFSFMIFTLLYIPCVATIGAINREAGTKWAIISASLSLLIAYLTAMICYQGASIARLKGGGYILGVILSGAIFIFTALTIIYELISRSKGKKTASECKGCENTNCLKRTKKK